MLSSHQTFLLVEEISFGICVSEYEYCASILVSPLLKRRLPNLSSLFQRNVRALRL